MKKRLMISKKGRILLSKCSAVQCSQSVSQSRYQKEEENETD
jgi:hypothetical protein